MVWVVQPSAFEALKKICSVHGHQAFDLGLVEESSADENPGTAEPTWELVDKSWEGYDL